jgi:hypothetical protein
LSRIKKLPPPALVVAMIALFVAFSGTGYAAVKIARNSITSIHVKDRSLLAKDFKSGQIPRGPAGAAGPAGPTGPAGAATASARVLSGGDGDDPRARGINDAGVSKPAAGVYCIDIEGGAVNVVATLDSGGASGEIRGSTLLTNCPSGKEVEIHTADSAGTAADRAFYVLVN